MTQSMAPDLEEENQALRMSCDEIAYERDSLKTVLRGLFESLAVDGSPRIVGIPNLSKFWVAYDAAQRFL